MKILAVLLVDYNSNWFAGLAGFEREPQDTVVYPGQITYLGCQLGGNTKHVNISWLKDEQPLMLDESRMSILPSGKFYISIAI